MTRPLVFITGAWGLGENVVQGSVDPDDFYVFKPTFEQGRRAVLRRSLGSKKLRMACREGGTREATYNVPTTPDEQAWIAERMGKDVTVDGVTGRLTHFLVEPFLPHPQSDEYYVCINSVREGEDILFYHAGGVDVGDREVQDREARGHVIRLRVRDGREAGDDLRVRHELALRERCIDRGANLRQVVGGEPGKARLRRLRQPRRQDELTAGLEAKGKAAEQGLGHVRLPVLRQQPHGTNHFELVEPRLARTPFRHAAQLDVGQAKFGARQNTVVDGAGPYHW